LTPSSSDPAGTGFRATRTDNGIRLPAEQPLLRREQHFLKSEELELLCELQPALLDLLIRLLDDVRLVVRVDLHCPIDVSEPEVGSDELAARPRRLSGDHEKRPRP